MQSGNGDPSIVLWIASACIAFLGARTFVEYLRRLNYDGPVRLWRELLLCAAALTGGFWSALVIDIGAQGLAFEIGYHPLRIFGSLVAVYLIVVMTVAWVTFRPAWPSQMATAVLAGLLGVILQMSVIWSIGAEPGLYWQARPLALGTVVMVLGMGMAGRMVVRARRGSRADRSSRRLIAALILGACTVAAQELVLHASGLEKQVVSANARFLPESIIMLIAGAAVPIALVMMLVDQRTQQRARASDRARRRSKMAEGGGNESMFSDSVLAEMAEAQKARQR